MVRNILLAALFAASSMVAMPQSANAMTSAATYPECWLNCVWISTDHNGGGYWICEVQMDCVNP